MGVKIAVVIISSLSSLLHYANIGVIIPAILVPKTVAGSSFTGTGGDVVVQVQLPAPNMIDSGLASVWYSDNEPIYRTRTHVHIVWFMHIVKSLIFLVN